MTDGTPTEDKVVEITVHDKNPKAKPLDKRKRAASIIHTHALGASALAGVLAQVAVVNIPTTAVLAGNMFSNLIRVYHPDIEDVEDMAASLGAMFVGWGASTLVARSVIGVVPVFGNVANAAITFTLFESLGWAVYAILEDGRELTTITKEEFKKFVKIGQRKKLDVNKAIQKMPPHDRAEYDRLVEQLKHKDLSDEARAETHDAISALLDRYL